MTKKLYYADSHQDSCHATVLFLYMECEKTVLEVVLDQTVFFPRAAASMPTPEFWAA